MLSPQSLLSGKKHMSHPVSLMILFKYKELGKKLFNKVQDNFK